MLVDRRGGRACLRCMPRLYKADPSNAIVHPTYVPYSARTSVAEDDDVIAARAEVGNVPVCMHTFTSCVRHITEARRGGTPNLGWD